MSNALKLRWFSALCLTTLLSVGVGCQNESAKWQYADAINQYEAGKTDEAIAQLQDIIDNTSDNDEMKLKLAEMYASHEQADLGISLCDEYLEKYPDSVEARRVRSECLQYLARFEEALNDYQESLAGLAKLNPTQLNNLAYFRTLAKNDLPLAAKQIDEAIREMRFTNWGCRYQVPLTVRCSVAIGLIARHVDQQEAAAKALDQQINLELVEWARKKSNGRQLTALFTAAQFPFDEKTEDRINRSRDVVELSRQSLALLLATRCLVNEDLGKSDLVDNDRRLISQLDFDFEQLVAELPTDLACLEVLRRNATVFLDTRGFVTAQLPWQSEDVHRWSKSLEMDSPGLLASYEMALQDLDLSIAAAELNYLAVRSPLYNRYDYPIEFVEFLKNGFKRTLAVLRYHRMQAHLKAGKKQLAQLDADRIKELGLDPNACLF
ncbi:MAG: hypothetical protein AAFN77_06270 [Planctomycetota bacterium]